MRILLTSSLALLLSSGVVRADGDAALVKKLVGTHGLTLQWITFNKSPKGSAEITAANGSTDAKLPLTLRGTQDAGKDGRLEIDGVIERVAADRFFFKGKITTQVSHINQGQPCTREGTYEFVTKNGRKYWRMYPIDNTCDQVADYVDVHFGPPTPVTNK